VVLVFETCSALPPMGAHSPVVEPALFDVPRMKVPPGDVPATTPIGT